MAFSLFLRCPSRRVTALSPSRSGTRQQMRPKGATSHDYHVWREGLSSVQEISAFTVLMPNLIAPGVQPESVSVASMSASGFRVTRVPPLMGRYFDEKDDREGALSVVVIGEDVWRNRFLGDPSILGRTIQLGATLHSIVGVMPKGFAFPVNNHFWVPLRAGPAPPEPRMGTPLMVFGRLAPGVTLASAQAELAVHRPAHGSGVSKTLCAAAPPGAALHLPFAQHPRNRRRQRYPRDARAFSLLCWCLFV